MNDRSLKDIRNTMKRIAQFDDGSGNIEPYLNHIDAMRVILMLWERLDAIDGLGVGRDDE